MKIIESMLSILALIVMVLFIYFVTLAVKCEQNSFDKGHDHAKLVGNRCYSYIGNGNYKRIF